jgi:hypothetical protein
MAMQLADAYDLEI